MWACAARAPLEREKTLPVSFYATLNAPQSYTRRAASKAAKAEKTESKKRKASPSLDEEQQAQRGGGEAPLEDGGKQEEQLVEAEAPQGDAADAAIAAGEQGPAQDCKDDS